ncbi:helicase-related protein [Hymenobacter chitinivorans]|uniref:Type III restriction/modification enzyme restriction subunit n=1 Tax=Hymenobacter chitinivorans DSM 11115 TaxID=1121954 RepID=A0A2M9BNG0_9BACT|nr:helicase-related protein [Hymenobacter chitinivorans]PJJ59476.1 type III restriction/modification enzyme restriction subunit [Hymenobacter chitinivorans DSM 11115]
MNSIPLDIADDAAGRPALAVGPGAGMIMAKHCLPQAKDTIRLASVYFSLTGYDLTRHLMSGGATLRILIGQDDEPKAHRAVLKEILADLGQCERPLTEAIEDLVHRMEAGQFFIREARGYTTSYGYHCKFYLMDGSIGWHGSTNFSGRGLRDSAEQASLLTDPQQIALLARWFDEVAAHGRDLLAELLARLQAWLRMAMPFEIYLKVLAAVRRLEEPSRRPQADLPTHYQQLLISRAVRQLTEFSGALVVAATGLGKTVLGAEVVAHCRARGLTRRCIVIGPAGLRKQWLRHVCEDRDIKADYFSLETLFQPNSENEEHQIELLRQKLQTADTHTLLLIDEVHTYRNQWLRESLQAESSRVFTRLVPAIQQQGLHVLLLTATVYGTDFGNLKSLLHMLPLQPKSAAQPGTEWEARTAAQFAMLPIVTVFGIPHVLQLARERGDVDELERVYVEFNKQRCYLPPELHLYAPRYQLPCETAMQRALDEERFASTKHVLHAYFSEQMRLEKGTTNSLFNDAIEAWLSSPWALAQNLARNLATPGQRDPVPDNLPDAEAPRPYGYALKQKQSTRYQVLAPLLDQCTQESYTHNHKFGLLRTIVQRACLDYTGPSTGKVLVFVNRWATAIYLVKGLAYIFGANLRVASTVIELANGTAELLLSSKRNKILRDFAPVAHKRPAGSGFDYHVLICTDADGKGVNLQDADTLVHYDLPTAADELYQRVGRLLRLTPNPNRRISIYTLEPALGYANQGELLTVASKSQQKIATLLNRLQRRHDHSQSIMATSVRGRQEYTQEPLENASVIMTVDLMTDPTFIEATDAPAQAELRHLSVLSRYRDIANNLPENGLHSARAYQGSQARIIVLLLVAGHYNLFRYNLKLEKLEKPTEEEMLEQLACEVDTERVALPTSLVENSANVAIQVWCSMNGLPLEGAIKVCALYLDPRGMINRGPNRLFS